MISNRSIPGLSILAGMMAMLMLPACSSTSAMISSLVGPKVRADENLPEAASLDQDHTRRLYLIVVDRLRKQGSSRAALSYLDEYQKQYPDDREAQLMRADCLVSVDSGQQAAPIYKALLRSDYRPAANAGLGKIAVANADWPEAMERFQAAVNLNPSNADYLNNLAYAQMRGARYDVALATLQQALQLDPGNTTVRNNIILCLHMSGREAEVQNRLQAIASDDDRRAVMAMLARFAEASAATSPVHG